MDCLSSVLNYHYSLFYLMILNKNGKKDAFKVYGGPIRINWEFQCCDTTEEEKASDFCTSGNFFKTRSLLLSVTTIKARGS